MTNKSLFGSASSSIIAGFTAIESLMNAVNTTAMACNNLADVALITSEGYKKSAVLKQQQELAELQKELTEVPAEPAPAEEEGK